MSNQAPSFPSLYDFAIEILPIQHRNPVLPGGKYLHHPHDIYRFTLYWTLIFYTPAFVICGIYAFINITFPPYRLLNTPKGQINTSDIYRTLPSFSLQLQSASSSHPAIHATGSEIPLEPFSVTTPTSLSPDHRSPHTRSPVQQRVRLNERRSRLTFAVIVLFIFLTFSVAGAVVGSAVMGYALAGLFKAAHWTMSTWIPFFAGLIQALIGLLGLWPSVIDII